MSDKAIDWLRANAPDFVKAAFDAQDAENARLANELQEAQKLLADQAAVIDAYMQKKAERKIAATRGW